MKILTVPNKILYQEVAPVETFGSKLRLLIDRMFILMYRHRGIGLAANQVGVLRQIVVLNVTGFTPMTLINPVVHDRRSGRTWETESCLSVPNYHTVVERAGEIQVRSFDHRGQKQDFETTGLLARAIQHEVDHLHGVLINEE
jgi:peptide deformylase